MTHRYDSQRQKRDMWRADFQAGQCFQSDPELVTMRQKVTEEFVQRFRMAYLNYEAGEWRASRDILDVTRFLLGREDGASSALLKYMKQFKERPADWPGFRPLPLPL